MDSSEKTNFQRKIKQNIKIERKSAQAKKLAIDDKSKVEFSLKNEEYGLVGFNRNIRRERRSPKGISQLKHIEIERGT